MSQKKLTAQAFNLTKKDQAIVHRALRELFSKSSLEPLTVEMTRDMSFLDLVSRSPSGNIGRDKLLSKAAHAALTRLIRLLDSSHSDQRFGISDIDRALRKVCVSCFQAGQVPENAEELLGLLIEEIGPQIARRTYIATIYGVRLKPEQQLKLGAFALRSEALNVIHEAGMDSGDMLDFPSTATFAKSACIYGPLLGTREATMERFKEQATLAASMLAVDTGVNYQRAAAGFGIEVRIGRPATISQGTFAHWIDGDKNSLSYNVGGGSKQPLDFTDERIAELSGSPIFQHAFSVFQKVKRESLEEAFVRAVYWYGDAHTDETVVMQFVKYWSCLECLLGSSHDKLTESLSSNAVALLALGPLQLFKPEEAAEKLKDIKKLYGARSKAVHNASHSHISFDNVVTLSMLSAYVIFNVLIYLQSGWTSRDQFWKNLLKLKTELGIRGDEATPSRNEDVNTSDVPAASEAPQGRSS